MALGHSILVPLDGSDFAERVLPLATAIAKHSGGTLRLLRVHGDWLPILNSPPAAAGVVAEAEREAREASERYIEEAMGSLLDSGIKVEAEVRLGAPHEEILGAAAEGSCDLIAMATHGRGGFSRLWLGSIADRVVREAEIPVLLVSAAGHEDEPPPPPPGEVRTVIIPLDGSPFSEQALVPATALGDVFSADYILYRSISAIGVAPLSSLGDAYAGLPEALEPERAGVKRAMETAAGRLREAGYTVTVVVSEEEEPARGLLGLAAATPGSVIAMSTHGRGGVARAMLGSVADKVVRASAGPVLLVRPRED